MLVTAPLTNRNVAGMEIISTRIDKLRVEDISGLKDGMTIILESTCPKQGFATIRYGGYTWGSSWDAMPQDSVIEFFSKAPCDYLMDKMSGICSHKADHTGLKKKAVIVLLGLRRDKEISKEDSREHYTKINEMGNPLHCSDSMTAVFGAEWFNSVDSIQNPEYVFASKVMAAAQEAVLHAIASGQLSIK